MEQHTKISMPNTQLSYLNYLRFGSIMLVILLHSVSNFVADPNFYSLPSYKLLLVFNEIGRAGVPMFFMISGYLLLRDQRTLDCCPFYRRRLNRILIPVAIWNAVYCIYYHKSIAVYFKESIQQGCAYHLWFVYTILGIYLLAPFLKRMVDSCTRKQLWWLLTLVSFTGTLRPIFNLVTPFYLYLFPPLMEGYISYFLFGYLFGTMSLARNKERFASLLMIVSGFLLGVVGNYLLSSPDQLNLPFNSGYSLNHFLLAGGIFLLSRTCQWLERPRIRAVGRLLSALTFQIYFVHVLVMDLSAKWVPDAGPVYTSCFLFLMTAAGSTLFSLILHGVFRLFLGKK